MKLHLGCWNRYLPGFVHVDLCDLPHIDHQRSIDDLSIFDDNSATLIYSSHSFEYFDRNEGVNVLKEWFRVLKKGGVLRLAVPDFDALINIYKKTGILENILGPLYGRMEIETNKLNKDTKYIYHKTSYNYNELETILLSSGYTNIKKYDWKKTIHLNYDDHSQAYFPHMDKENGLLLSLNIEAQK
jgi:predicted SAM-dependent methyltransferase